MLDSYQEQNIQIIQPVPLIKEQVVSSNAPTILEPDLNNLTATSYFNNKPTLKQDTTTALLSQIFPEQNREDKSIKQARAILGGLLEKFSTDELQETIILLQYLTESWLDMYERELFDGMTLNELLNLG